MSAADIYRQYLTDYEDAAKKYNRSASAYNNSVDYQSGPIHAKSQDGQQLGLYSTPDGNRNIVKTGTEADYQAAMDAAQGDNRAAIGNFTPNQQQVGTGIGTWTVREGQDPKAIHSFGNSLNGGDGWYTDVGNGYAGKRTNGRGTGEYITERIAGDSQMAQQLAESGKYKAVNLVSPGDGETSGLIDVTYEQQKFAQSPGSFDAKKPSLSMAQTREMQNPTPTMAEVELGGGGIIDAARGKFASTAPAAGLIQRFR